MITERPKEILFYACIGLVLTGALWRVLSGSADPALDGDTRTEVILAILYGAVGLFCMIQFRSTAWLLLHFPALSGLLLLVCMSSLWAETPDLVFRRSISLLGTSLFGVLLAARLNFAEQLRLARLVLRVAAVACLVLFIVAPSYAMATDYGTGSIRAIFPHKNLFGAAMALGLLVEWYAFDAGGLARSTKFVSLGLFTGLLIVSRSITSIVTLGLTLVILWLFEKFHQRYRIPLPAILLFLVGIVLCVIFFGIDTSFLTQMLGRSKDLTGRTELWHSVGSMISARPLLGYGFSGFWSGASSESFAVERYVGWTPTYSHNGYLEILLNVGIVGTGLLVIFLSKGLSRAVYLAEERTVKEEMWPLAFLVFFVVHNCAECSILLQNCFEWSLFLATVMSANPIVYALMNGKPLSHEFTSYSVGDQYAAIEQEYAKRA